MFGEHEPRPETEDGDAMTRADALAPIVLALVAALVVTVATRGPDVLPPILPLEGRWTLAVRIGGAALALAGLRGLLVLRGALGAGRARGSGSTVGSLRAAATIMVVLAVVAILTRPPAPRPESAGAAGSTGAFGWIESPGGEGSAGIPSRSRGGTQPIRGSRLEGGRPPPVGPGLTATAEASDPGLLGRVIRSLGPILILLLIAAVAYRAFQRRRGRPREIRELSLEDPAARAAVALAESWDHVTLEGIDPHGQIQGAYRRLLRALAAAGAPRAGHEAPHEHLRRTLGSLGVRAEPLHRLAELYVMAEFAERPVSEEHRAEAREALAVGLADLRSVVGRGPARRVRA